MNHFSMTPLFKDGCSSLRDCEELSQIVISYYAGFAWRDEWLQQLQHRKRRCGTYTRNNRRSGATEEVGLSSWTFYLGLQQSESTFHRTRLNDV